MVPNLTATAPQAAGGKRNSLTNTFTAVTSSLSAGQLSEMSRSTGRKNTVVDVLEVVAAEGVKYVQMDCVDLNFSSISYSYL